MKDYLNISGIKALLRIINSMYLIYDNARDNV